MSRQAVHEWIKGGALAPRNALRLSELAQVADVFVESGIEVTPQVLRRKIGGGHSIMESVKEDGNVVGLLRGYVSHSMTYFSRQHSLSSDCLDLPHATHFSPVAASTSRCG